MSTPGSCAIVAEAVVEAAAVPGMGYYICAHSGANPYVCGPSIPINVFPLVLQCSPAP